MNTCKKIDIQNLFVEINRYLTIFIEIRAQYQNKFKIFKIHKVNKTILFGKVNNSRNKLFYDFILYKM